jgi:glycosyltransferase involved in cell wall biosynthesis
MGFFTSFRGNSLDRFNSFWLGVLSGCQLVATDVGYVIVLFFFLALFSRFLSHPVMSILIESTALRTKRYLIFPFQLLSLVFNWSLYYFRKWVLNWNEERNWGEHYQNRLNHLALQDRKERGIVAVFNQNYDKYTETFVKGHIGQLPFHTIPFHGWPSMIHTGNMENLVADHHYMQRAKYAWWQLTDQNARDKENDLIAQRLIKENVQVILAEFGTVGARLLDVSKQTGIPLITIFYGYDAWHRDVLSENEVGYEQLFKQASAVIGVSRDICNQLAVLGCVPEKIIHLPCYVNLELFKPVQRDFSRKILLAVGRFCITKAPDLTILAFSEVLRSHPDAELRMVGADDGNGIMESCRSLVKALGIQENVKFLGSMSSENVAAEMRNASVFVQHSITAPETGDKEGTPVAIMEAMACGLPIVSTRHAGIQEVVQDGISGILVNEFDYLRMAKEITELLGHPERLEEISYAASNGIRANRSVADHIQILSEIIDIHKVKA